MLFHFSFYWNKHPSLPAAGHEPAVEPGRHHLSRVKFYQLQARWFGAGRSLGTLALKTFVDQFIYTPFISNPFQTLAFLWKAEHFSFRSAVVKLSHFKQLYVITVLPVLVSNWCFWIPTSALIYCFPTTLQLPLGILAVSIWSMLLAALLKPTDSK
jgi:hypothetical protein